MFALATDVQKIIMEFLDPEEIKELYVTCKDSKVMFDELTKHTNFIVICKFVLLNKQIKWFKSRNIKLKLFEEYKYTYRRSIWYKNGEYHRDNDLPAVIQANGEQRWYQYGKLHRDNDLPAIIYYNGDQFWYKNGLSHRDNDLPAIIRINGEQYWFKNDIKYYPN